MVRTRDLYLANCSTSSIFPRCSCTSCFTIQLSVLHLPRVPHRPLGLTTTTHIRTFPRSSHDARQARVFLSGSCSHRTAGSRLHAHNLQCSRQVIARPHVNVLDIVPNLPKAFFTSLAFCIDSSLSAVLMPSKPARAILSLESMSVWPVQTFAAHRCSVPRLAGCKEYEWPMSLPFPTQPYLM
jgi:hypothetical protein